MLKTNLKLLSQNNLDLDALEIYDMPGFSEKNNFLTDKNMKKIIKKKSSEKNSNEESNEEELNE